MKSWIPTSAARHPVFLWAAVLLCAAPLPAQFFCEDINVQTGKPRVTSLSSITGVGTVDPGGIFVARGLELISTASLSEGGTPSRQFVPGGGTSSAGSYSLGFNGLQANTDYAVRAFANSPGCGDVTGPWVIVRITPRDVWLHDNFGGNTSNPAIGGLHADPDGDGLPNLHEWLANTDPKASNWGYFPVARNDIAPPNWNINFTYHFWRPFQGDEWMLLEYSTDLKEWHGMPGDSFLDAAVSPAARNIGGFLNVPAAPGAPGSMYFRAKAGLIGRERIPGLFSTGLDDSRQRLEDGYIDHHWEVIPSGIAGSNSPVNRTSAAGYPVAPAGPWLGDSPASGWLSPHWSLTGTAGNYIYRTRFNIPYGVDPRTVSISGKFTSDNAITAMTLNGSATGITGDGNYSQFGPEWLLTRGFVGGGNKLEITVNEPDGSYTGFRAELDGLMQRPGRVAIPGCINSGCSVLDGTPHAHGTTPVTGVTVVRPGQPAPVAPVVAASSGGWPVAAGGWFPETSSSAWLKPDPSASHPAGQYVFIREFNLTGLDPATVEIRGRVAADDNVIILLNEREIIGIPQSSYTGWAAFELPGHLRSALNPGRNTIAFSVNNLPFNGTNPCGLRYEFLHAAAQPLSP